MSASGEYRKVTMMMENPSYDGFLDGRGERRPHHRIRPFVFVILLLLAVVGVAVALAIILTGNKTNSDVPGETSSRPEEFDAVTILGSLHISNREYKMPYADKSTKEFAAFETEVEDAVDRVYNKSIFKNIYVGTSVSEIRKGSVIVDFAIHLEIPKTLFDMKSGEGKKVSGPEYNEAYVHLVKAIDSNQLGGFAIMEFSLSFDSDSLSFDTITMPPVSKTVEQVDYMMTTQPNSPVLPDVCRSDPCTNGGTCLSQPDAAPYFACQCPEGRSGYICQTPLRSLCDADPCTNNSTCEGGHNFYRCLCAAGYTGDSCETTLIAVCETNPCQHGGTCRGDTYFFYCACAAGWGGRLCENVVPSNPCNSNPCLHGGQCWSRTVDTEEQYECICPPSFSGQHCENSNLPREPSEVNPTVSVPLGPSECIDIPIPECCPFVPYNQTVSPNPFQLAGNAEDLLEFFELSYHFLTPDCHPDAQRVLCTVLNPKCPGQATDGQQWGHRASIVDFQLPCLSVCREVHDSCLATLPGELRGEFEVFGNFCYSLPESAEESVCFGSTKPGSPHNEPIGCRSSPCENGGACLELNGMIRCRCPRGYAGQTCAYELPNPCYPNPCLNGGVCVVGEGSLVPRFTCNCPAPYQPPYCDSGQ